MVAPSAAAVGKRKELVSRGPFGRRDHEKGKLCTFVAPDGSAQFSDAGDGRTFAGVVEPAFGGQCGELARICRRGRLSPSTDAPDF